LVDAASSEHAELIEEHRAAILDSFADSLMVDSMVHVIDN